MQAVVDRVGYSSAEWWKTEEYWYSSVDFYLLGERYRRRLRQSNLPQAFCVVLLYLAGGGFSWIVRLRLCTIGSSQPSEKWSHDPTDFSPFSACPQERSAPLLACVQSIVHRLDGEKAKRFVPATST